MPLHHSPETATGVQPLGFTLRCPVIVSTDTLRPQDLIARFDAFLQGIDPNYHTTELANSAQLSLQLLKAEDDGKVDLGEDSSIEIVETSILLEEELNRHAPEGWYFGASEGDGSYFGYWECETNE